MLAAQGTDGVYTTMTQFLAAAATAYVVVRGAAGATATSESGLGEVVLAGAVSRWRWLLTAVRAGRSSGAAVLMFFAGLGNGSRRGHHDRRAVDRLRLTLAGLAFVPAIAVRGRRRGAGGRAAPARGSAGSQ